MMKTLYVSDLDGTLLNKDAVLSRRTAEIMGELINRGLNFTVATARTAASAVKIMAKVPLRLPVILMNGVLIYDISKSKYIKIRHIPPGDAAFVLDAMAALDITGFAYTIENGQMSVFYENLKSQPLRDFYEERRKKYYKTFDKVNSFNEIAKSSMIYYTFIDTREKLEPLCAAVAHNPAIITAFYKDIYSDNLWYLEIFSAKASKYHAVRYLREELGFDRVVGFGDNLNDLPLFRACDESCAVENAVPALRRRADKIIGSNADDGVARYLDALIEK